MFLPISLQKSLDIILKDIDFQRVRKSSAALSESYRNFQKQLTFEKEKFYAYLSVRLPATYAVLYRVFKELQKMMPIQELLDIGCGPGTSLWAAREFFDLKKATLVEKETGFIGLAQKLQPQDAVVNWMNVDMKGISSLPSHDAVLFSYSYGEMESEAILNHAWEASKKVLILIEPGTPKGFARILRAREYLKKRNAIIAAPCGHQDDCPLMRMSKASEDSKWCHFSVRVGRTQIHRTLKNATLSYEDEKFCYLILFKEKPLLKPYGRILHQPIHRSGHTQLVLCQESEIKTKIYSKKNLSLYRSAKKAVWGDSWTQEEC
jgi:ribosomal protein RSM22 (predicted rRNA methylase)